MRGFVLIAGVSLCAACYPPLNQVYVPVAHLGDASLTEAQLQQGLAMCNTAANDARARAYAAHKKGFVSRRVGAVATLLSGSAATALSAAGKKNWATGLSASTVLSAVFTAAFVDDAELTAAEAGQTKTLAQLAGVSEAYRQYLEATDSVTKHKALNSLARTLGQCGFDPVQAIVN